MLLCPVSALDPKGGERMFNAPITLIGHIGDTTGLMTASSGKVWLRLRVATNYGKNFERTSWHTVKFFDNLAEAASKLSKGEAVTIYGELREDEWPDKENPELIRRAHVVYADSLALTKWK